MYTQAGVMFIVVLAYWGRQHVVIPEDHTLLVAKQMSNIGANVIIGNHPRLVQDHAYMGNTLVIFSQGNAAINKNDMCWTPVSIVNINTLFIINTSHGSLNGTSSFLPHHSTKYESLVKKNYKFLPSSYTPPFLFALYASSASPT